MTTSTEGSSWVVWYIVTGLVGLLLAGIFLLVSRGSLKKLTKPRDSFMLVGLSGSGKTSLFALLRTGTIVGTYTSLKTNEAYVRPIDEDGSALTDTPLKLLDLPGHEKLRTQEFKKRLPETRAIVVMVDSFTATKGASQLSELLYDILSIPSFTTHNLPLLIVANKRDLATSITPEKLKSLLESEINTVRLARTATNLENLGDEPDLTHDQEPSTQFVGLEGKDFQFDHLTNDVTFLPLSLGSVPKPGAPRHTANLGQVEAIVRWMEDSPRPL